MKKRIALVNQRYGPDVVGGSETYTRLIAQRLSERYEVEILTTCALDHITWKNLYAQGEEIIEGVRVRRFPTQRQRDIGRFEKLSRDILYRFEMAPLCEQRNWLDEQGPYVPSLIAHIREHKADYDAFIFVTYLYYPTVYGIKEAADKAILIPTAHNEPAIHLDIYKDVFSAPRAIVFLTEEERTFVHKAFHNEEIPSDVMGIGVSLPEDKKESETARALSGTEYIVYIGRIEQAKGCKVLFDYFEFYKQRCASGLKLVLLGKADMDVPARSDICPLGFVSEADKFFILKNAGALVLPSQYESLSIAVLEALAVGTPILVNGQSEVLRGHCIKSNAGLYYTDYFEFEGCLSYLRIHEESRRAMGENGRAYVTQRYAWENIMRRFDVLMEPFFKGEGTA